MSVTIRARHLVILISLQLTSLPFAAHTAQAVDRITIGDEANNRYLPYGLDSIRSDPRRKSDGEITTPFQPYRVGHGDNGKAVYATCINSDKLTDPRADFSLINFPSKSFFFELPARLSIRSYGFFKSTRSLNPGILVGGYRNDSAFAYRAFVRDSAEVDKGDSTRKEIFLDRGVDHDSDGFWAGRPDWVGSLDYDFDGREESFFWLNPIRDISPRELFCLDPDSARVKWAVPVASGVKAGQVVRVEDSANPRILFTAYGMGQGARDSQFFSTYGYVGVIDRYGHLLDRRFAGKFSDDPTILKLTGDSLFALYHTLPLLTTEAEAESDSAHEIISLIDSRLNIIKSDTLPLHVVSIWDSDYNGDGVTEIYTLSVDGILRVFDRNLVLLAESPLSSLRLHLATMQGYGDHDGEVFVFETTRGMEIYGHDFQKLAALGDYYKCQVIALDGQERVSTVLLQSSKEILIARIVKRPWIYKVSAFYEANQVWILSALFSLAAGLMVMNFYRSRVSRQRTQISLAHKELAETHEALKQAQATIIAQEKYKQAKDMAGAFAHEIRNALFPADSALTKLVQLESQPVTDAERLCSLRESIRSSVTRAIGITEEISTYTKLDTLYAPEPVRVAAITAEISRSYGVLLEEHCVKFETAGPAESIVIANKAHLAAVFSNLVLNSLHALQGRKDGTIRMAWRPITDHVEISVFDNGCGIPPDQIDRIFDAFFSTKATKGTGLGLATSRKIVEMYSGTISVQSLFGTSTQFTIVLPAGPTGNGAESQPLTQ